MHTLRLIFPVHFAVCAGLLCISFALGAQTEKWKTYKYPEEGFRISFPVEPKVERSQKEAEKGSIKMVSYCAQISASYLCVAVIDQGAQATGLEPAGLLERAKLGLLTAPKTKKLHEEQIELDGHTGVELETENDTDHIFTRIYVVNGTLYQSMVTLPVGDRYPSTGRFLDSFRLIPRLRY
jgi:hypothetical protein